VGLHVREARVVGEAREVEDLLVEREVVDGDREPRRGLAGVAHDVLAPLQPEEVGVEHPDPGRSAGRRSLLHGAEA